MSRDLDRPGRLTETCGHQGENVQGPRKTDGDTCMDTKGDYERVSRDLGRHMDTKGD